MWDNVKCRRALVGGARRAGAAQQHGTRDGTIVRGGAAACEGEGAGGVNGGVDGGGDYDGSYDGDGDGDGDGDNGGDGDGNSDGNGDGDGDECGGDVGIARETNQGGDGARTSAPTAVVGVPPPLAAVATSGVAVDVAVEAREEAIACLYNLSCNGDDDNRLRREIWASREVRAVVLLAGTTAGQPPALRQNALKLLANLTRVPALGPDLVRYGVRAVLGCEEKGDEESERGEGSGDGGSGDGGSGDGGGGGGEGSGSGIGKGKEEEAREMFGDGARRLKGIKASRGSCALL